ncbi:hypothetical protein FOS14_06665 [Skermania sp. ID1734]|uniref:hypothetical protein n=1 Tax=Skermania sp. ID1734 TaxID=2597516 RepID=UPI00117F0BFD|nr:hypothetical protein [Skermania sp. ID1734]TSE00700.1 hypothetical protein FOS14_06665 [Skermania sp. ID1734]
MFKQVLTKSLVVAAITASAAVAAPAAAQADPAPLFNIPVEILPYIQVPQPIHDAIVGFAGNVNDAIVAYNNANSAVVQGVAGAVGNILCLLSAGSSQPCAPAPHQ